MTPLLEIDSVGKRFGARQVLKAASVWAERGRITALFGRNGCGKTTLLRIGVGLLRADHGVVHYDGRALMRPRLHALAGRGLFFLPDRALLPLRYPLGALFRAIEWRFGRGRSAEAVERLGLGPLLDRRPAQLSGGERRKAEIALAWARQPRCLVADEPFGGIEPGDAAGVVEALRSLARDGCALVLTGHEVEQILELADDVVWMTAGTTHGLGTPAQARVQAQFRREYLGADPDLSGATGPG